MHTDYGNANKQNDENTPRFSAILSPHRSLSQRGFKITMASVGLFSFTVGLWFYLKGAWPVMGFFGLDVLILYLAFKANYREGHVYETVELTNDALSITHHPVRGEQKKWHFNPYCVQLNLRERRGKCCVVEASSHGKKLVFAHFLSDDEKRDFTRHLNSALSRLKLN